MKKYLKDLEDMNNFAKILGRNLKKGDLVDLRGDLGAGKTTLVQGMKDIFNIDEDITSPSFSLVNIYDGDIGLYHLDLYRFEDEREIEALDYLEYFYPEDRISFLEWGQKVASYLPDERIRINISYEDQGRSIEIMEDNERERELVEDLDEYFDN